MNDKKSEVTTKEASIDVKGANCASCVYAIEHIGRKVDGVSDIRVDTPSQKIRIQYEGNPGSLERIVEIVKRLGYDAKINRDSNR